MSADYLAALPAATQEEIKQAAKIIAEGGLVAFPTETVYGLGANALDAYAVSGIYIAKGRPSDNPIIVHVSSVPMAEFVGEVNWMARYLMEKFWPGPLSLVIPSNPVVPETTRGGLATVGVRMPDNPIALALIETADTPIAAPSANKSGRPSPTDAETVRRDLGKNVDMVLDGGPTLVGLESTVLDVTGEHPVLLRPGGVSKEEIEKTLDMEVLLASDANSLKRSPGTRYRHYAPKVPLVLLGKEQHAFFCNSINKKWAWMGISEPPCVPEQKIIFRNLEEYARELFRAMRALESSGVEMIVAETPEEKGLGFALKDRLIRASGV